MCLTTVSLYLETACLYILVPDPQAGMCLTTVSLYLETACLYIFVPDPQAGMCLTTVSLYLETACLPALVFCLLLVPILRHGQGHALLSYSVQTDDWDGPEVFYLK